MAPMPDIGPARIRWVDVFATGPLTGNPLAVVLVDQHPDDHTMQALAAELGLSETVFAARGDRVRLRIFTPTTEIPMAGHPLVGTAWVLRDEGWIGDHAVLVAPGGEVAAMADDDGAFMAPPAPRLVRTVDGDEIADALGCQVGQAEGGMAPVWDAGLPQVMLRTMHPDGIHMRPDRDARLVALGARDGWAGVSAYSLESPAPGVVRADVRHFAAPIGIAEDPVTGSAAGALAAALVGQGLASGGALDLTVRQGHGMGRAGEVRVHATAHGDVPTALRVGGRVLPVLRGELG